MLARDLASRQEARDLVENGLIAQKKLNLLTQVDVDCIVGAMAKKASESAEALAQLAVTETGMGNVDDKTAKNLLVSTKLYEFIKNMKTVGVVAEDKAKKIVEIAAPVGVIAAVIPTTNPTATVIAKSMSALKSRNAIVFSPHPRAVKCSMEAVRVMQEAAQAAGAPENAISCMAAPTIEGTNELMQHPKVALILATGGGGLVKAAYSSGRPAYGVGPGNVPVFIERSSDLRDAARKVVKGRSFDNGTICSSEEAVIVEDTIKDSILKEFSLAGAYLVKDVQQQKNLEELVIVQGRVNPNIVGKSAVKIAEMAGFKVPPTTKVLLVALEGVGNDYPLSKEKLSPILAFYSVANYLEGFERCLDILGLGGLGHTAAIHTNNQDVIKEFALRMPTSRVLINVPSSTGAVGAETGLAPSMTLGCGSWGGNITTDNITPYHLLNIKRMAYGVESSNVGAQDDKEGQGASLEAKVIGKLRAL